MMNGSTLLQKYYAANAKADQLEQRNRELVEALIEKLWYFIVCVKDKFNDDSDICQSAKKHLGYIMEYKTKQTTTQEVTKP